MPLVQIQVRRSTAAQFTAVNPVLAAGEPALEIDTGKTKTGDGIRNWTALPYDIESGLSSAAPSAVGNDSAGTARLAARADHSHPIPQTLAATNISASGNVTVAGNLTVTGTLSSGGTSVDADDIAGLAERVDDRVSELLSAGAGIVLEYDDAANTLTVNVGEHSQPIESVIALQQALDSKAASVHTHDIIGVNGLTQALDGKVGSDTSAIPGATVISNIVSVSQATYNALPTKNPNTLYVIT